MVKKNSTFNNPLISVVLPSLNQGCFLEQTITSVIGQSYKNIQLIVMDGGSIDDSVEIIKKYEKHIDYWVSEPDGGQANAINKGFKIARGDILAWLNSDDMYMPCTLENVVNILGKNVGKPSLLYGGCLHFYEERPTAYGSIPPSFDNVSLTYGDYIDQPSSFWTMELWNLTGRLDENYCYAFDWDWFIRASQVCDFIPTKQYLSLYRHHQNHKTGTGGEKRALEILDIVEKYASEDWIDAYNGLVGKVWTLKKWRNRLKYYRAFKARYLLHPYLYIKYGEKKIRTVTSMI